MGSDIYLHIYMYSQHTQNITNVIKNDVPAQSLYGYDMYMEFWTSVIYSFSKEIIFHSGQNILQ